MSLLIKNDKTLATKAELKAQRDEIVKLQTYDLSLFIGILSMLEHNFVSYFNRFIIL